MEEYAVVGAMKLAAQDAMRQLLQMAADVLEARPEDLEAKDKRIYVKGSPERSVSYPEAIHAGVVRNQADPIIGRGHNQAVQAVDRNPSLAKAKGRWTDATGVRITTLPITTDKIVEGLERIRKT